MDSEQLFSSVQERLLKTPAYRGIPFFPDEVRQMRTLEALVWWLGATNFAASSLGADYVALSELALIHTLFDSSNERLMKLIFFITNLDTPGFLDESNTNEFPGSVSPYEATDAIAAAVRRRPHLRKAVAQWIIFEHNVAGYDTLTLAHLAEQVEREYRWEFGERAFASSTQDMANALVSTETERESLRKMITLALEIGTRHIRSRLAVNWLAQVRLRDPAIQKVLDDLKEMTVKQIWQRYLTKEEHQ